jgi:uncharacterized membrane protein
MDYSSYIDLVGKFIDILGVVGIVAGVILALYNFILSYFRHDFDKAYGVLRENLGRTVLLGLELLIAGDIIRSIAVPPTLTSVAVLAVIVLIRSFLSMQIEKEIKWSFPWKRHKEE